MNILLINGPNLNLLGTREPEIYGNKTLSDIEKDLTKAAESKKTLLECFQSNHEGEIVDKIHDSVNRIQGILINAGAFTHTSISIRDALIGSKIPFILINSARIPCRIKEIIFILFYYLRFSCSNTFGPALVGT